MPRSRMVALAVAVVVVVGIGVWLSQQERPGTALASPTGAASASAAGTPAGSGGLLAPTGYLGNGTIAFSRNDPAIDESAVYLINPDGSGETRLRLVSPWAGGSSELDGYGCCPVFSPSGLRVAVGFNDNSGAGSEGTWRQTQIVNLDGSPASTVPVRCVACESILGIDYDPRAWSPDGRLLALQVWSDADATRSGINVAPLDGTDWAIQISGAGSDDIPVAFSPDGTRLLFVRLAPSERPGALWELTMPALQADGTLLPGPLAIRQVSPSGLTVTFNDYFGQSASYSPDGSQIAFVGTDASGSGRVYVVDADGGEPTAIAGPGEFVTSAGWSPDGSWIVFDLSTPGGRHDLYIIRPDGTGQTNLTESFDPGICCSVWSPDGTALLGQATVTSDDQAYLFIVPIDGSTIYQVTTTPALYENVSWGAASR